MCDTCQSMRQMMEELEKNGPEIFREAEEEMKRVKNEYGWIVDDD